MYLADYEIKAREGEMGITGPNPEHPFEPERQIQPCSIDLRVSNIFWKPRRRRRFWRQLMPWRDVTIDLRRSNLHDLDPIRDWKQFEVKEGQSVTIKPGQAIMARVYERFHMPADCAGKIEGRSSFARLGLAVHCTGDFINPGWQGYMPLQLLNMGPYPVRLGPYFSICQLMLIRLAGQPERSYGDVELRSKYDNDDGGPSLWWRDARVEQLQKRLGQLNAHEAIRRQIVEKVRFQSPEVLARFQHDIDREHVGQVENADQVLDRFASRESKRRRRDSVLMALPGVCGAAWFASVLDLFSLQWFVFLGLLVLSCMPALIAYERFDDGYLGKRELKELPPPDKTA